jgi:4-diphosphocytidyl-2-C-methyl-D-erythritol kinase
LATAEAGRHPVTVATEIAPGLGSDVLLFFTGGSMLVTGVGDQIESQPPLSGFAAAIAVPPFELSTPDVYRRWDDMEGPVGETLEPRRLPPAIRDGIPIRNDLTPAAVSLQPELADFMADLRAQWEGPVALTGSGSACFGFFPDPDEAADAAKAVSSICRSSVGAGLRDRGVTRAP